MLSLRLITRNISPQLAASTQRFHTSKILLDSSSSDSDSSDDEKQKKKVQEVKKHAENAKSVHRLNSLLQAMTQQSKTDSKVNVAVNRKKPVKQEYQKIFPRDSQSVTKDIFQAKVAGAAKEVAISLGGHVNKTESELLKKIFTPGTQEPMDLSKLVLGMQIDRTKSTTTDKSSSRADQVRAVMQKTNRYTNRSQQMNSSLMKEKRRTPDVSIDARVDLDSGIAIGIFKPETEAVFDPNMPTLSTWELLEKKELKLMITHPPNNYIEEMIQWTEQGKLWRFPIDNEQDMHLGQEEHFSEHIFLEQHLEGWCPTRGPIRHFMELVCVGLSKNPYMFAKDKKERIMWFKNYFESKRQLLEELGAYGAETMKSTSEKQIES